jgi:hypothetical protein
MERTPRSSWKSQFHGFVEVKVNMSKKSLIETLEVQIAIPDPAHSVAIENYLAEWGAVPYSHLSIILVGLRHLALVHQTHHWTTKGDPFYGDHLLFERLYNTVVGEIDGLGEKAVGLGGADVVNLQLQVSQLSKMIKTYGTSSTIPQTTDLAKRSLIAEIGFLRCVDHCVCAMKELNLLTRGLDNFLAGVQDVHEDHCYLLKQRCTKGITA